MKTLAAILSIVVFSAHANVTIKNESYGSGNGNIENAFEVENNIFHAPQYMPGYPTSAVIYPRVIDVECEKTVDGLNCGGYNWLPSNGRGEYLFFRPQVKEASVPTVQPQNVVVIEKVVEIAKQQKLPIKKKPKRKAIKKTCAK